MRSKRELGILARRYTGALTIVLVFIVIGSVLLLVSHAATPFISAEPENGTVSNPAAAIVDTTASGGQAVKFGPANTGGNLFLNGLFPIGVFVQPTGNFSLWKSRGINTLVAVPQGTAVDPWATAADQAGLYQIRGYRSNPSADLNDPLLLAIDQPDEPDGIFSQIPYSTLQTNYNNWKAIKSSIPVYINFIGALNQFDVTGACSDRVYRSSCASGDSWYAHYVATADWLSADGYPANSGQSLAVVGQMVDHLRALGASAGKPAFAFIESSDYNTSDSFPGPTADNVRAEMWDAIIHGVRGLWFFPERITPSFAFDATPAANVTEITKQSGIITQLAPVLQGTINPGGMSVTVASPLEAAWRSTSASKYAIVLNLSNAARSAQSITLTGFGTSTSATVYGENRTVPISSGRITDDFAAYGLHIYQID